MIELVSFLEQTHGLDFTVVAFDPDDFDSIEGMAQLVSGSA